MKKPNTDLATLQNDILPAFIPFIVFLKTYFPSVYKEISQSYFDLMSSIVYYGFKQYSESLSKSIFDVYLKSDLILHEEAIYIRGTFQFYPQGIVPDLRTIFSLMSREWILDNLNDPTLNILTVQKMNQKILLEGYYRSVMKGLIDSIKSEFKFNYKFFLFELKDLKERISKLYELTCTMLLDSMKALLNNTCDIYSILLIACITSRQRKTPELDGIFSIQNYFDQILQLCWMRVEKLFEIQLSAVKGLSGKQFRSLEKDVGSKLLLMRYIDFALGLYRMQSYINENSMLKIRLIQLRAAMIELLKKTAKEIKNELEGLIFITNAYDLILNQFSSHSEIVSQEDTSAFEKEKLIVIGKVIEIILYDEFRNLVDFVKKYASENFKQLSELELESPKTSRPSSPKSSKDLKQINTKQIESVNQEFVEKWEGKLELLKEKTSKMFGNGVTFGQVLKKILTDLLSYYNSFSKYVKENYSSYSNSLIPIHVSMKKIDQYKKLIS